MEVVQSDAVTVAEVLGRSADGIVLSLPLTQEQLGRLVGARRPTVSLALRSLRREARRRKRVGERAAGGFRRLWRFEI